MGLPLYRSPSQERACKGEESDTCTERAVSETPSTPTMVSEPFRLAFDPWEASWQDWTEELERSAPGDFAAVSEQDYLSGGGALYQPGQSRQHSLARQETSAAQQLGVQGRTPPEPAPSNPLRSTRAQDTIPEYIRRRRALYSTYPSSEYIRRRRDAMPPPGQELVAEDEPEADSGFGAPLRRFTRSSGRRMSFDTRAAEVLTVPIRESVSVPLRPRMSFDRGTLERLDLDERVVLSESPTQLSERQSSDVNSHISDAAVELESSQLSEFMRFFSNTSPPSPPQETAAPREDDVVFLASISNAWTSSLTSSQQVFPTTNNTPSPAIEHLFADASGSNIISLSTQGLEHDARENGRFFTAFNQDRTAMADRERIRRRNIYVNYLNTRWDELRRELSEYNEGETEVPQGVVDRVRRTIALYQGLHSDLLSIYYRTYREGIV